MGEVERLQSLLVDMQRGLGDLESAIKDKQQALDLATRARQQAEDQLTKTIGERAELEKVLTECAVDVCRYKAEFAEIKRQHGHQARNLGLDRQFHFFLCFRGDYSSCGSTVIDAHREMIKKHRYTWWGKFASMRDSSGAYESLEPFGESIDSAAESAVAGTIRSRVRERHEKGERVYLYLCDPNPPDVALHVAKVEEFVFGPDCIPCCERDGGRAQDCRRIPTYLFAERANCAACRVPGNDKCVYRFKCNFWFKISAISQIEDVRSEFVNLTSVFTNDSINFAIPILYPLLVYQKEERFHFQERDRPFECADDIDFRLKAGEQGHTDSDKVEGFFNRLHVACGRCIARVDSVPFCAGQSDSYSVKAGPEHNQIRIELPGEYRRNRSPSSYVIYLDKRTTARQRKTALEMMREYLQGPTP